MGFMKGWNETLSRWMGIHVDDDGNMKVAIQNALAQITGDVNVDTKLRDRTDPTAEAKERQGEYDPTSKGATQQLVGIDAAVLTAINAALKATDQPVSNAGLTALATAIAAGKVAISDAVLDSLVIVDGRLQVVNRFTGANDAATPGYCAAVGYSDGVNLQQVSPTNPMPVNPGSIVCGTAFKLHNSDNSALPAGTYDIAVDGSGLRGWNLQYVGTGTGPTTVNLMYRAHATETPGYVAALTAALFCATSANALKVLVPTSTLISTATLPVDCQIEIVVPASTTFKGWLTPIPA